MDYDSDVNTGSREEKITPEEALELHPKRPKPMQLNYKSVLVVLGGVGFLITMIVMLGFVFSSGPDTHSRDSGHTPKPLSDELIDQQGSIASWPQDYSFMQPSPATEEKPAVPDGPVHPMPHDQIIEAPPVDSLQKELIQDMIERMHQGFDSPLVIQRRQQSELRYPLPEHRIGTDSRDELRSLIAANPLQAPQSSELLFLRNPGRLPHRVSGTLQSPLTPYELRAGSVIPAALITAIHSDLPGDLIAQVTDNLYDVETGKHLLIPQGSRLIGTYNSDIPEGRNRVLVVWQRLILPNGKSIDIDAMPGVDQTGAAGLHDQVDYHIENVIGATALSSVIALTGNLARGQGDDDVRSVVGETVAQESARFGQQVIDRELRRPPTITVRSGHLFNVLVNRDIPLEPYKPVR